MEIKGKLDIAISVLNNRFKYIEEFSYFSGNLIKYDYGEHEIRLYFDPFNENDYTIQYDKYFSELNEIILEIEDEINIKYREFELNKILNLDKK